MGGRAKVEDFGAKFYGLEGQVTPIAMLYVASSCKLAAVLAAR